MADIEDLQKAFAKFIEEIKETQLMTHASIVIAMTAVLDSHLEGAIKKQFRALSADLHGKIFEFPGPLSSFASKIYMAYAMKVISKEVYDELNKVRKIRNTMAHTSDLLHLTSPEIKSVFESLKRPKDFKGRPTLVFARCVAEICVALSSAPVDEPDSKKTSLAQG